MSSPQKDPSLACDPHATTMLPLDPAPDPREVQLFLKKAIDFHNKKLSPEEFSREVQRLFPLFKAFKAQKFDLRLFLMENNEEIPVKSIEFKDSSSNQIHFLNQEAQNPVNQRTNQAEEKNLRKINVKFEMKEKIEHDASGLKPNTNFEVPKVERKVEEKLKNVPCFKPLSKIDIDSFKNQKKLDFVPKIEKPLHKKISKTDKKFNLKGFSLFRKVSSYWKSKEAEYPYPYYKSFRFVHKKRNKKFAVEYLDLKTSG